MGVIVGKGRDSSRGKRGSLRGGNDGMLHKLKIDVVFFSRYFLFLGLRSASLHGPIVEVMDSGRPCRRMKGQQSLPFVKRAVVRLRKNQRETTATRAGHANGCKPTSVRNHLVTDREHGTGSRQQQPLSSIVIIASLRVLCHRTLAPTRSAIQRWSKLPAVFGRL